MPSWSCKTLQKWVLCSNKKLLSVAECCGSLTSLFQFVQRVRMTTKSLSTNGKKWKVLLMTRTKWWAQVQTLLCFSSSLLSLESTHSSRSSGGSVQLFASFYLFFFFDHCLLSMSHPILSFVHSFEITSAYNRSCCLREWVMILEIRQHSQLLLKPCTLVAPWHLRVTNI